MLTWCYYPIQLIDVTITQLHTMLRDHPVEQFHQQDNIKHNPTMASNELTIHH